MYITLTPAYGDYKSKKEVLADFNANKDFIAQPEGRYANKEDLDNQCSGSYTVNIRYGKLRKVVVITVKNKVVKPS